MSYLCKQVGLNFAIAHCNFQLRPKAATQDEKFVKDLAAQFDVDYYHKSFKTEAYAKKYKISIQMAARDLRYEWFEQIRAKHGFDFIATAHHLNDSIETLMMNLIKGTGIKGLHGIQPKVGFVLRPLLFASQTQISDFVRKESLAFREDESNLSDKYLRNQVRHEIIPAMAKLNPDFEATFQANIKRFSQVETIYEQALEGFRKQLMFARGEEYFIPFRKLMRYQAAESICFELLKDFGFNNSQVVQLLSTDKRQSGKRFESSSHRIIQDRNWWIISPNQIP